MGVFDEVSGTGRVYLFSQLHGKTNSNHVTSVLDNHISKYKTGKNQKRKIRVQLDNCSVNKCYVLIRYAADLVKSGRYDEVEVCFMVPGHTKFNPDRMFAWLSDLLRTIDVFEISDIVAAVDRACEIYRSQNGGREHPYSVENIDQFNLIGEFIHFSDWNSRFEDTFRRFGYLNESHRFEVKKDESKTVLRVQQYSESDPKITDFIKESVPLKPLRRLSKVHLKPAKVQDLSKVLKFIPGGSLSYVDE